MYIPPWQRVENEIADEQMKQWEQEQERRNKNYYDLKGSRPTQEVPVRWIPYVHGKTNLNPGKMYLFTYGEAYVGFGKIGWRHMVEMDNGEDIPLTVINAYAEKPEPYKTPKEVKDAYVEANSGH